MTTADVGATRYAGLTRPQAAGVLGLWLIVTGWFLAGLAKSPPPSVLAPARDGFSDVALYKAIVARVRAGEGYYDAAGLELRAHHYATWPVFHWRQPTYAWILSRLPHPLVGNAILVVIGAVVVALTHRWLRASSSPGRALVGAALMAVTMSSALVADFVFLQESWSGALIALSLCLFAFDLWPAAVLASLAALAFRELALLPCGIGLLLALRRRRWREVGAWLVGLGAYAALVSWHVVEVVRRHRPGDLERGWTSLGGSSFLVDTCQWNGLFAMLPRWLVALTVPLVLIGLVGWRGEATDRVAFVVLGFMAVFAFVGNSFNDYWGAIYAPLLPLGLVAVPQSARDLSRALSRADP